MREDERNMEILKIGETSGRKMGEMCGARNIKMVDVDKSNSTPVLRA